MVPMTFIWWIYHFWARFWPYFNFVDFRAYFGPFSLVNRDQQKMADFIMKMASNKKMQENKPTLKFNFTIEKRWGVSKFSFWHSHWALSCSFNNKLCSLNFFCYIPDDDSLLNLWKWWLTTTSTKYVRISGFLPLRFWNLSRHRLGLAMSPCIPGQYRFVLGCPLCCATWAAAAAAWCKSSNLK